MKKRFAIMLVLTLLVILLPLSAVVHADMVYMYKLIVGQTQELGRVWVWNDEDTLYVKFDLWYSNYYCLRATHVHAADTVDGIPQRNGNPTPGRFDYSQSHACGTRYALHEIPLGDWGPGDPVIIAGHVALGMVNDPYWQETGWGVRCGDIEKYSFPGSSWAAYIDYTIQQW